MMKSTLLFLVILLFLPDTSHAETYYVSKAGGTHGAGLDSAPYETWTGAARSPKTVIDYISANHVEGPHTIYLDDDTFDGADYCYFHDSRCHSYIVMIGAGRDKTVIKPKEFHAVYATQGNSVTIKDMSLYSSAKYNAVWKYDGCDDWLFENVSFISDWSARSHLVYIQGDRTDFCRCRFQHRAYGDSVALYCLGDSNGTIKFCTFCPINAFGYSGPIVFYGSGNTIFLNNTVVACAAQALIANYGTVFVKNTILHGGLINSASSTVHKLGGILNLENNIILANPWNGQAFIEGDIDIDSNNIISNIDPKFVGIRGGFILPCVDDSGSFSYAQNLEDVLGSFAMRGTFFLDQISWNSVNNEALRDMVSAGHLEVASHSYSHSDLELTGKIYDVTKNAETISIDRSTDTITLSGGGYVANFRHKKLMEIKSELEGLGATVTPTTIYTQGGATVDHIRGNTLGEVIDAGTATNQIDILIDTTAVSGYYKTEISNPKEWLTNGIINVGGDVTDGQTGHTYVCNSFGAPFNSLSANAERAILNAGFTSGRGSIGIAGVSDVVYGNDINMYDLTCAGTTFLNDEREEVIRENARALGLAVVFSGMVLPVLAHSVAELPIAGWAYCLDEWSKIEGLTVTSQQLMALEVSRGGKWFSNGDGTYSRTYDSLNLSLNRGSPCINSGTDPFSDGDGDQYDMRGLKVWSDDIDAPVGPWGDGVDIGAYGYVGTPIPDIKANGSDGPLYVDSVDPVSITIALDVGDKADVNADWWIAALTPFGWFSYVYPSSWEAGINLCIQTPIFNLPQPVEVLNIPLPYPGVYNFYFAIDSNADGVPDPSWFDIVTVTVQ